MQKEAMSPVSCICQRETAIAQYDSSQLRARNNNNNKRASKDANTHTVSAGVGQSSSGGAFEAFEALSDVPRPAVRKVVQRKDVVRFVVRVPAAVGRERPDREHKRGPDVHQLFPGLFLRDLDRAVRAVTVRDAVSGEELVHLQNQEGDAIIEHSVPKRRFLTVGNHGFARPTSPERPLEPALGCGNSSVTLHEPFSKLRGGSNSTVLPCQPLPAFKKIG